MTGCYKALCILFTQASMGAQMTCKTHQCYLQNRTVVHPTNSIRPTKHPMTALQEYLILGLSGILHASGFSAHVTRPFPRDQWAPHSTNTADASCPSSSLHPGCTSPVRLVSGSWHASPWQNGR